MTKTIIAGVIGLILIATALVGFSMLFDKVEAYLPEVEDVTTEEVTNKPSGGSDTSKPSGGASTTEPSGTDSNIVYANGIKVGYSVVNEYTYFFAYYDNYSTDGVFWKASNLQEPDTHNIKPYGNYSLYIAESKDGVNWELDEYDYHDFYVGPGKRLFVSYTRIKNCSNPDYVLEDLKQNVFNDPYYFYWKIDNAAG